MILSISPFAIPSIMLEGMMFTTNWLKKSICLFVMSCAIAAVFGIVTPFPGFATFPTISSIRSAIVVANSNHVFQVS